MIIAALAMFAFCSWAVLSKRFRDGVLAKMFLSLAAITSFIGVMDIHNYAATLCAAVFLICGMSWAWYKHRHKVFLPHVIQGR